MQMQMDFPECFDPPNGFGAEEGERNVTDWCMYVMDIVWCTCCMEGHYL